MIENQVRKNPAPAESNETDKDSFKMYQRGSKLSIKTEKEDATSNSAQGQVCEQPETLHAHRRCRVPDKMAPAPDDLAKTSSNRIQRVKQPNYLLKDKMEWTRR